MIPARLQDAYLGASVQDRRNPAHKHWYGSPKTLFGTILAGSRQRHRVLRRTVMGFGAEYARMSRHLVPAIIEKESGSELDED